MVTKHFCIFVANGAARQWTTARWVTGGSFFWKRVIMSRLRQQSLHCCTLMYCKHRILFTIFTYSHNSYNKMHVKSMDIWCTILTTGLLDSTFFCIRLWLRFDCKNNPWPRTAVVTCIKKADCTVCKIIHAQQYRWFIVAIWLFVTERRQFFFEKRLKATKQKKQTREQVTGDTMLICRTIMWTF